MRRGRRRRRRWLWNDLTKTTPACRSCKNWNAHCLVPEPPDEADASGAADSTPAPSPPAVADSPSAAGSASSSPSCSASSSSCRVGTVSWSHSGAV
eukprot:6743741-Pyramimonas_sp.AAC.1